MTKFGDKTILHVHVQVTSSFSQPLYYHLGESVFVFRGFRCDFIYFFFLSFFDELSESKQNSPCHICVFILFAYVPQKGRQAYMS